MTDARQTLVEISDLVKEYADRTALFQQPTPLRAVDKVSLSIARGESVGLVGESGSGKTTLGRCILRLTPTTSGRITFDGVNVLDLKREPMRRLRRRMQVVFQDPYGSLNPRMTVGDAVREPIVVHRIVPSPEVGARVSALFEEVGLDLSFVNRYPHELSGGQRQRVGIARALSVEPEFVVLDEPVSALDVSVQAQVLNLLSDLRDRHNLTYLFIAHDLAVVRHVADRVAVMYLGRLMEVSPAEDVYREPLHPYTRSLLSAVPSPDPEVQRERIVLRGDVPSPREPPSGCVFHPRCPHPRKDDRCRTEIPPLRQLRVERWAACHHAEDPLDDPTHLA